MNGQGTTTVSVVMPVYNAAATLAQAMQSVLGQTHRAVELVVVDDGSRDGSSAVIDAFAAADPRVVTVRLAGNSGVAAARNAGIDAATGDCMAFLDSDDWWHPRKLAVQLAWMRDSGVPISYTAYQRVDEAGAELSVVQPPATVCYRDMLRSNRIGNLTGIYDRRVGDGRFQRVGHEDYAFWLAMVRRAGVAGCAWKSGRSISSPAAPSRSRSTPSTTTSSPAFTPLASVIRCPSTGPRVTGRSATVWSFFTT